MDGCRLDASIFLEQNIEYITISYALDVCTSKSGDFKGLDDEDEIVRNSAFGQRALARSDYFDGTAIAELWP